MQGDRNVSQERSDCNKPRVPRTWGGMKPVPCRPCRLRVWMGGTDDMAYFCGFSLIRTEKAKTSRSSHYILADRFCDNQPNH